MYTCQQVPANNVYSRVTANRMPIRGVSTLPRCGTVRKAALVTACALLFNGCGGDEGGVDSLASDSSQLQNASLANEENPTIEKRAVPGTVVKIASNGSVLPTGINASDQVAGTTKLAGSDSEQAFFFDGKRTMPIRTQGAGYSLAFSLNNSGMVVGTAGTADGGQQAYVWTKKGGIIVLGPLSPRHLFSLATAVNASGLVIGTSSLDGVSETHAFAWSAAHGAKLIPSLGGINYSATAVSNSGMIVGESSICDDPTHCDPLLLDSHAFAWTKKGGTVDLGTLGGANSRATAVNNAGMVVGVSTNISESELGFAWTKKHGMVELGTLEFGGTYPTDLNESGMVVGTSGSRPGQAFAWTRGGGILNLGTLGGSFSSATAVNDSGVVVGRSADADDSLRAFMWTKEGGMVDLNSRVAPASTDLLLTNSLAISSKGSVVAEASDGSIVLVRGVFAGDAPGRN